MDKQYDKINRWPRRRPESRNAHQFTQNDPKKISNWKTPEHDEIYGFWFKKLTSIHDRLVLEMNKCLQRAHVPERMTKGRTQAK